MHHTVLVTGGSAGIGRATAIAYGTRGASVAFTYRKDRAAADEVTRQVIAAGGRALPVAMDLADPDSIHAAIAQVEEWENGIGVLVANAYDAGGWTPGVPTPFEQIPVTRWQHILRSNLEGTFHLIQAVLPTMRKLGTGRIVLLSSGAVESGSSGAGPYAAAKSGLHGLCRSLSAELGPNNILVNIVMPGITTTERAMELLPEPVTTMVTGSTPTGRLSTADDVARAIRFLGSVDNGNITGEILRVSGGK